MKARISLDGEVPYRIEYIECRTFLRHSWTRIGPMLVDPDRETSLLQRVYCPRCKTTKTIVMLKSGRLGNPKYRNPKDYKLTRDLMDPVKLRRVGLQSWLKEKRS